MRLKTTILAALALLVPALAHASARQVAIGAAAGYIEPPGYRAVPVYVTPNGGAWQPADNSMGYVFREPIYWTPKGYRYRYVRGYYWKRVAYHHAKPVYRKAAVKARATKKPRRSGPCVTDNGAGRYENCRSYF